ncbi:hypothetical protein FRC08_016719 [Ceratobasidium sp. 394]|nr:hypothetical protein FRC08_016719 [Ceratobasidium sp. 394]
MARNSQKKKKEEEEKKRRAWAPSDSVYRRDDEGLEWDQPLSKEELAKAKSHGLDAHRKHVEDEDDREESGKSKDEDIEAVGLSTQKHKGDCDEEFAPSEPEGGSSEKEDEATELMWWIMALPRKERARVLGSISAPSASTSKSQLKKPVEDAPVTGPSRQTTSTKHGCSQSPVVACRQLDLAERGHSQSPVVSKKRQQMIVSNNEGAEEGDNKDDEKEGDMQTLKQGDKKIVMDAVHEEFKTLAALNKLMADVRASLPRVDGELQYWEEDKHQMRVLMPNWEAGFSANWEVWGCVLMEGFRKWMAKKSATTHLADVGEATVCEIFRKATWNTVRMAAQSVAKGTQEEDQLKHNARSLENTRRNKSPQQSDGETQGQMVRLKPPWLAQEAVDIKMALKQKAKLGEARDQPVAYFQVDLPIQKASKTLVYPAWAMRAEWIDENKEAYKKSKYMIDLKATVKPNTSDLNKYGTTTRKYIQRLPPCASQYCLSISPSVPSSRAATPLIQPSDSPVHGMQGPFITAPCPIIPMPRFELAEPQVHPGGYDVMTH